MVSYESHRKEPEVGGRLGLTASMGSTSQGQVLLLELLVALL